MTKHTPHPDQPQLPYAETGPNPSGLCMCGCGQPTTISPRNYKNRGLVKGQPIRYVHGHGGGHAPTIEPSVRFWKYVAVDSPDKCWPWTGAHHDFGYGVMHDGTRLVGAHRFSWQIHNGPIPDGMWVCHHCDNPPCVNPAHLFLGTTQDNTQDMINKGRYNHVSQPGESNPFSKLTDMEVRQIRQDFAGGTSAKELAKKYNVTSVNIYNIVKRKGWAHVT